jgi:NAD(P) transhydrogenase
VGARPYRPKDVDFSHPRIFDSDTILRLEETPHSITIYGAGIIGCEYASMFRNLGCKVNLINTRAKLLEFLDDEITDALAYHLREQGILIRHNEEYQAIQGQADGVVVSLKSGKQIKSDVVLWANGRTGNSDRLGVDAVGLTPDGRGYLAVNESPTSTRSET